MHNLDSGVVLPSALVLVAPTTVQMLRLHLTKTQEARNLDFVPDDNSRVVSDEADYRKLMTGIKLPLAKRSHFVQGRASRMSLPSDFVCGFFIARRPKANMYSNLWLPHSQWPG